MRTTLKIVLPLIVSVAVVSLLFAAYQVRREKRILRNDLSRRAEILGESLQEGVEPLLDRGPDKGLQRLRCTAAQALCWRLRPECRPLSNCGR